MPAQVKFYYTLCISFVLMVASMMDVFCQQSVRLNSNWEFLKQDIGGVWEAVRPVTKDGPESVPLWEKVNLPHCFNSRDAVDPGMNYYQGPGWYRTQLTVDNPYKNGRTLLHFEGAGQNTSVYVYTTLVATHKGGYDEWTADITEAVANFKKTEAFINRFKGKIPVAIRCDNTRDLESIPSRLSDFNVYGGIYRYLNLVYAPQISIDKIFANPVVNPDGSGTLNLRARFYNATTSATPDLKVTVAAPHGKTVNQFSYHSSTTDSDQVIQAIKIKHPQLWSPSSPLLYTVEISYKVDDKIFIKTEKVGFRSFEFKEHGPFILNGERLLLRGTHRHEDQSGVGAAMTEDMIRREMQMIKDMGANFIRLGHYQQSRIVLDLCDSLGLLVWEEEPWCRGGLGGSVYQTEAKQMLTNMIEQHYNHPAIILWGLGNENDWEGDFSIFDKEAIRTFMKQQNDLAHRLDPARNTTIRRCDFCADIPDVYSPSIWAGWYKGNYTQYKELSEAEFKKVPRFIHAEWGGDSHAGRFTEDLDDQPNGTIILRKSDLLEHSKKITAANDGDWSETYICNLFDWTLKEQENMPWLSGSAFWTFKDFSTPLRPENPIPYMNQKGVVESDLKKKEAYYVVQSYWSNVPMAHIFGHNFPARWGKEGENKLVKVYANCEQAELFVNGKSAGMRKRNSGHFPAAGLSWMVPMYKGENKFKVVATRGRIIVIDTLTQLYQTAKWSSPAQLTLTSQRDTDGNVKINVVIKDQNNVPCLDAANWLRFSLSGDGNLLDDLGTVGGSRKVQAVNGRGLIKIRLNGGASTLAVSSPGLPSVFIKVQ